MLEIDNADKPAAPPPQRVSHIQFVQQILPIQIFTRNDARHLGYSTKTGAPMKLTF